jgi:predicted CXXCH cytochrome family protein
MRAVGLRLAVALTVAGCSSPSPDHTKKAAPSVERCATCHMDAFRSARAPVHVGNRPDTCAICHTEKTWRPSVLNHPWPLADAHAKASCFACHKAAAETFRSTPKDCVACHRKEYERAPNHVARKFPTQCAPCHDAKSWRDRLVP